MRKLKALALTCAIFLVPSIARAGWVNGTVTHQATVYRQANDSSEALGHLREGKAIRVYTPERNGFYAVNFGKPIKGTNIGWIATGDVELEPGALQAAEKLIGKRRSSGPRLKSSWLDISYDLLMVSPSAFQTVIGEEVKGIMGSQFGLTYGHRISNSTLGYQLGAFYYKIDGKGTNTYNAKGFGATAGLDLQFLRESGFVVSGVAQVGMSVSTAGNATTAIEFSTSNIIAFPLRVELDVRKYFGGFGFVLGGGYQIASLKEVPVVLAGTNAQGNPNESVADFALSGIYGHLGISINFE